jgi:hypothetical protein
MPEREPTDAYAELIERLSAEQQLGSAAEQFDHLPHEQREALELRVGHDLATTRSAAVSRSRARRLAAGAAVAAVVCLTGVGIAGTYEDWWTNARPAVNPEQVQRDIDENTIGVLAPDRSRKATVATTPDAALVAVATKTGGYCLIPSLVDRPSIGNSCTSRADDELRAYASPPGSKTQHWIAYGHVNDARAAALDLHALGLAQLVPVERGGFFLFDVPRPQWAALDDRHGALRVLDSGGGVVGLGCVWLGPAPGARGSGDGWGWLGLGRDASCDQHVPLPLVVEVEKARKLVELTLTDKFGIYRAGDTIALWQAPSTDGQICVFMSPAGAQPTFPDGPRCRKPNGAWPAPAIEAGTGSTLEGDRYTNMTTGIVDPRSGIVRVALESAAGSKDVAFAGGAFMAELPSSPRAGKRVGPIPGAPYTLVGYDANGARVAAVTIDGRPVP